jgi:ATP-dependent helicase/nuclease subunit B
VTETSISTDALGPNVSAIPPELPFVDCLARELLARHGGSLEELGQVTILTTTRRAARALQNAFLRETGGSPLLLPRMRPLGDVDEDELLLDGAAGVDPLGDGAASLDIPPAIDPMRRQLLLARMIERRQGDKMDFAQCAALAKELARLLDQIQTEGLDFKDLKALVPEDYAEHWQITLEFLTLISDLWPDILAAEGTIDPARRRDMLIRTQTEEWRQTPPAGLIYAVGSTGSIPATAELLTLIASLPNGRVILPGLDRHLDEKSWDLVRQEPGHPQFGLAVLLDRMGLKRRDVPDLTDPAIQSCIVGRPALLSDALRPAETTDLWQLSKAPVAGALENVRLINCPGPQAEAQAIALAMRQTLEEPTKTAVLITPDRDLSRRVSTELKRWDIDVDDSAGSSLDQSPPGVFLRLTARMMAEKCAPIAFLAALKHPYASMGLPADKFRRYIRMLELNVLRGPRPAPGLSGISDIIRTSDFPEEFLNWFSDFETLARPFETLSGRKEVPFIDLFKAHVHFAEQLANDGQSEASGLWRGHFGEAAAGFVAELLRSADAMETITPGTWPDLLDSLMSGHMVRARYGLHPRLQIWGPIEGRLQRADLVILGGMNDGIWPPDPGSDPWMSRPMRQDFQLPSPEKKIGLSAHDFQQAFCSKEVILTRSEKVDGTPMVPSRWLLRLQTLLKKFDQSLVTQGSDQILGWQMALDRPDRYAPVSAPRPTPPVSSRPRRLSVTRIEKWLKDPYSIFADAILKLKPLDGIAEDPGAADRGNFIHKALEEFVKKYPDTLPPNAEEELLEMGRDAFGQMLSYPAVWAFWWPRYERIAEWFVSFERTRRENYKTVLLEKKGILDIAAPGGTFVLSGTADRMDRHKDGGIAIIDYKTGSPPSTKEVESGLAPQLSLEAAMVEKGAFGRDVSHSVIELLYIKLSGGNPAGEARQAGKDLSVETLAEEAFSGLQRLIAQFDKEATPYLTKPRPAFVDKFNDYEHLARVKEWSGGGQDE